MNKRQQMWKRIGLLSSRLDRLASRMLAYDLKTGQRLEPPSDSEVVDELTAVIAALAALTDETQ